MSLPVILALALAPFKKRFTLNKKEGGTPMTEEPDEKKKADEDEEAKKAAAIARYDEAMAGLDPDKFENESSGEDPARPPGHPKPPPSQRSRWTRASRSWCRPSSTSLLSQLQTLARLHSVGLSVSA